MSNKCDLEEQTAVSEVEGQALAARIGAAFVEVNAKAGHNIVEVHENMANHSVLSDWGPLYTHSIHCIVVQM